MKNQEWQFVNLELSIKLKELGVKQDSYWCWVFNKGRYEDENRTYLLENSRAYNFEKENRCWNAYSVAELGAIFNKIGADMFIKAYGEVFDFKGTQRIGLLGVMKLMRIPDMSAKMLLYLIENKLINVEDINK